MSFRLLKKIYYPVSAEDITAPCGNRGVLYNTLGINSIKLSPSLNINHDYFILGNSPAIPREFIFRRISSKVVHFCRISGNGLRTRLLPLGKNAGMRPTEKGK